MSTCSGSSSRIAIRVGEQVPDRQHLLARILQRGDDAVADRPALDGEGGEGGHDPVPQAKETLTAALNDATAADDKQRTVILGTSPPSKRPSATPRPRAPMPSRPSSSSGSPGMPPAWTACWKSARPSTPWAELDCVQALDDRLYGWQATLSTLQR
jgi:hypothetical protein